MTIIICPGIHDPALTQSFVSGLQERSPNSNGENSVDILTFSGEGPLTLSALHILDFLHQNLDDKLKSPVVFISFSAGVVGAIMAARMWQLFGGHIKAFIAIDGWGVPLGGDFPIHRMSHDRFTHWSSKTLGGGQNNFYADPPVEHLSMWQAPGTVQGWWVDGESIPNQRLSASEFLLYLLLLYEEK
jgi:hypothetical protein